MFGLSFVGVTAFIKSVPFYIILALLAVLGVGYLAYEAKTAKLAANLATTQANLGKVLQSNKSLELDNLKRQKEFEANIKQQEGISKNDQDLLAQSALAKKQAQELSDKMDVIKSSDPEKFLKEINEDIGCRFEGYGQPVTCGTMESSPKEVKKP